MSRPTRTLLALALSCALAVGAVLVATTATSASAPGPGTQAQTLPTISMSGSIHEGTSTITVTSVDGFQTRTLQDQDPDHTIYFQRIKTRSMLAPSQPSGTSSHNSVLLQEPIGDGSVFTNYEAQPVDWADCVTREADGSTTSESCDLTLTIPAGTPSFTGKLLVQCRQGPGDPANADVPITAIVQTDWLPALDNPCVQSIPVVYTGSSPPPTAAFTASPSGVSSSSVSHDVVAPSLIVHSTGDAPATDPSKGCDTGGTVGTPTAPECTLRAAIQSLDVGVGGTKISLPLRSTVVSWSDVPGATPDDIIVAPFSNFLGRSLDPGFSYTGRSSGIADYCATTDPAGTFPCPFADYRNYFRIDSSTVTTIGATLHVTMINSALTQAGVLGDTDGSWGQVFTASSHGYLFFAGVGGQQVGQSDQSETFCQLNVPCTLGFSLRDNFGLYGGNNFVATSIINATGQTVGMAYIPLNPTPPATPPTGAFSATLSGTASHDWNFDGSASTAVAPATVASYRWTFGDGASETTTTPTTHHGYTDGSPHTASLIVVDSAGTSSVSVGHDLAEPALIVNSTGDAPATDPSKGCDTGGTVGTPSAPECTLRAAIQSLDAGVGGTKISFALPSGSTTITAATALPDITKAGATIDGTETSGMPTISGSPLHIKNAAGVTVTKVSVVASGDFGVFFDGSPGATLTSSSIGVSPGGVTAAAKFGVVMSSSGVVTVGGPNVGNVIAGTATALSIAPTAAISSLTVQGNSIGESAAGTLLPESGAIGFAVFANSDTPVTGAVVADNQIAGFTTNLSLAGAGVASPQITGNRIGVAADQDTLLGAARANLRLDGVPGAVVSGNQIAGAAGFDVLVSGSVQVSVQSSGTDGQVAVQYLYPGGTGLASPLTGPVVGTHDTISGNRIGTVTRHSTPADTGLAVWNPADDTTISGNTVLDHDSREIDAFGGSGARLSVTGNTVGAGAGATAGFAKGISLQGMPAPTVSQNTVGGVFSGIELASDVSGAVVSGNTVGFGSDGSTASPVALGISISGAGATVGPNNTVGNASQAGIFVSGSAAHVVSNRVGAAKFGSSASPNLVGIVVSAAATGTVVGGSGAGNTVVGSGTGLRLLGSSTDVGANTFGLITSGALGNGTGIDAQAPASIHDNTIANSSVVGVKVKSPVAVTMLHNSIYGTTGGIGVTGAPAAATVVEADRVVHGSSARTFLILSNVPTSAGTIEVFGNASCADPEARSPLFTTPTTSAANRVISVADRTGFSGLTVMVTTNGRTTTISSCGTAAAGLDSDGDGIPDAVEAAYPTSAGPAASAKDAAFVVDNQQWVLLTAATGTLSNVSPIDDPNPNGHPGATFPLGLIDWTLSGIEPGSMGTVVFTLPGTVINGWWKYSPHHDPQFYDYGYSSIAGYGAKVSAANVPGSGLSTLVAVLVPDGGVGDDDGLENGSVRDPSAPAAVAGLPAPPLTGSGPTVPVLATTGSNSAPDVTGGLAAILLGLTVLLIRRRRHRRSPSASD